MAYRLVLQAEIIEVFVWNAFAVIAVAVGFGAWGVAAGRSRVPWPGTYR